MLSSYEHMLSKQPDLQDPGQMRKMLEVGWEGADDIQLSLYYLSQWPYPSMHV